MQDDTGVKDAVEAAFGPGAFELIAELDEAELAALAASGTDGEEVDPATRATCEAPAKAAEQDVGQGRGNPRILDAAPPEPRALALLLFELAGQSFGISLDQVVEIQKVARMTRIIRGPRWLRGLANLRGTIIAIVDLQLRLNRHPVSRPDGGRLIVVRSREDDTLTGLIVDSVSSLRSVSAEDIREPAGGASAANEYVQGTIDCEGQPVTVLNLDTLLAQSVHSVPGPK